MHTDRVIYYGPNDLACGLHLDKIVSLEIPEYEDVDVNDAIEFNEIYKYFENNISNKNWTGEEEHTYRNKSKKLNGLAMRFFSSIKEEDIITIYNNVNIIYCSCFWTLFEKCKLYEKISSQKFNELIHCEHIPSHDIFKQKITVKTYGEVLRKYILDNLFLIDIVVHWYEQNFDGSEKLYRPDEFTGEDACNYLSCYLESNQTNLNVLESIKLMNKYDGFPITDELKLKAKRKYKYEGNKTLENGVCYHFGFDLAIDKDQEKECILERQENGIWKVSYSEKWLLDTLDYPSILNNFIYVFEFADIPQMRWNCVSRESEGGIIEKTLMKSSTKLYPCYTGFEAMSGLEKLKIQAYYDFLKRNKIRLEDVLTDFFTIYLQEEFNCPEIRVEFPVDSMSYSQKCSTIASTFESVLRQFKLLVNNGEIDFELLGISTTPVKFEDIPSFIDKKYIYGIGEDFKSLSFMLFSDQCMLAHNPRISEQEKNYNCLCDLLAHEDVYLSDYLEREYKSFDYLKEQDIINIDENGKIKLNNLAKIAILRDIFNNEVISRRHYGKDVQSTIMDMVDNGLLEEKSTLLSKPEVNYLNYMLNRAEYDNGKELRNIYLHGIGQAAFSEEENRVNYFELLRLFILLAIKINDDFCLKLQLSND